MFSRRNRLAKEGDVQMVYKRGKSFFTPFFTIKFLRSAGAISRFTVVVSTKVAKQAVRRNKIKRVVRERLRRDLSRLTVGDYMVIMKPSAIRFTPAELSDSIHIALVQNRLFS